MLDEHRTPRRYWAEAINTACHVSNHIFLQAFMKKTSYELQFGWPPKVIYFRVFECKCFLLKQGNLDKFESKSSDGIFLGLLLSLTHIVFLTLRLTESWRPMRSHSMKPCLVPLLSLIVQVIRRLVRAYLWRSRKSWLGWSRADSIGCPSRAYDVYFSSWPNPFFLLYAVRSSSILSLRLLHLRRPQLLLRGSRLLQGRHHDIISIVTHLRPWSVTSTSESCGPGHITSHTLLTLLSLLLLSLEMLDTHYLILIGSILCMRS
jgi:hypothetical protein